MKLIPYVMIALLATGSAEAVATDTSSLSPAESRIIAGQTAKLRHPEERKLVQEWSDAKKVAEMLCRPVAAPVLRRQVKGADRIFLGTDAADTLTLESNSRLTGTGTVRSPSGWRDFTFECQLNPRTGKATKFQATLKP